MEPWCRRTPAPTTGGFYSIHPEGAVHTLSSPEAAHPPSLFSPPGGKWLKAEATSERNSVNAQSPSNRGHHPVSRRRSPPRPHVRQDVRRRRLLGISAKDAHGQGLELADPCGAQVPTLDSPAQGSTSHTVRSSTRRRGGLDKGRMCAGQAEGCRTLSDAKYRKS